jgi:hypothetical protein
MFTRMEAALKEIEQRRLYEAELVAALGYCIKPYAIEQSEQVK